MSKRFNKKADVPVYEDKREQIALSNKVEVIKAHDGLSVGDVFVANPDTINKMVNLGYWKRCV